MTTQNKKNITRLALLFTVCGVLLLAVAVGSLILRCRALEQRLDAAFTFVPPCSCWNTRSSSLPGSAALMASMSR